MQAKSVRQETSTADQGGEANRMHTSSVLQLIQQTGVLHESGPGLACGMQFESRSKEWQQAKLSIKVGGLGTKSLRAANMASRAEDVQWAGSQIRAWAGRGCMGELA
eukprot:TRINITY_DN7897_c1_g1_i1.p2 TRINITY_DN7897_c1_g1~~TRINITY_DN7897_c1_g1_i1.p2  ORF type:complete len:107 (-),score=4.42 TRINITY_DN7897_c1_g1_i1:67-387(-)